MSGSRCFGLLETAWQIASRHFELSTLELQTLGGLVRVEAAGFDPSFLSRAIRCFAGRTDPRMELRVRLFYKSGVGVPVQAPPVGFAPLGLRGGLDDRYVGSHRPAFTVWMDREKGIVVGCCCPELLLPTDWAKPMHSLWLTWFKDRELPLLHASLVSHRGRGALVIGPSNSGKSTVALACLASGMKLVADDYVVCDVDLVGRGFYSGVWFEPQHSGLTDFDLQEALHHPREAKSCLLLDEEHWQAQAPIDVLVLPDYSGEVEFERITADTAYQALAPSTLENFPSARAQVLKRLVREVPAFRIGTNEPALIAERVARALELRGEDGPLG